MTVPYNIARRIVIAPVEAKYGTTDFEMERTSSKAMTTSPPSSKSTIESPLKRKTMATPPPPTKSTIETPDKLQFDWSAFIPFVLVHLMVFAAFWTGVTWQAWVCCVVLYNVRMFGVTAGYHRYFSHRTFKTGRLMQFLFAFLAQTSSQRGVLWWAAHHRHHHKFSDKPGDVHSPRLYGFWYSHLFWMYYHISDENTDQKVQDLAKFPELRFLNQFWFLPPALLGVATWALMGAPGFLVGFALSTVLLWHGTFSINSLAHVIGRRRYDTDDDSRNSMLLALITLGEGWHNNHHHCMHSTRQGFLWWEIDVTYYVLRLMAALRLIWDIREPKASIIAA